jgi:hypothetical protein
MINGRDPFEAARGSASRGGGPSEKTGLRAVAAKMLRALAAALAVRVVKKNFLRVHFSIISALVGS